MCHRYFVFQKKKTCVHTGTVEEVCPLMLFLIFQYSIRAASAYRERCSSSGRNRIRCSSPILAHSPRKLWESVQRSVVVNTRCIEVSQRRWRRIQERIDNPKVRILLFTVSCLITKLGKLYIPILFNSWEYSYLSQVNNFLLW